MGARQFIFSREFGLGKRSVTLQQNCLPLAPRTRAVIAQGSQRGRALVPIIPGQGKLFYLGLLIRRKLDLRGNHGLFLK